MADTSDIPAVSGHRCCQGFSSHTLIPNWPTSRSCSAQHQYLSVFKCRNQIQVWGHWWAFRNPVMMWELGYCHLSLQARHIYLLAEDNHFYCLLWPSLTCYEEMRLTPGVLHQLNLKTWAVSVSDCSTVSLHSECTRGGFCNFMHLKPISRELRRELYGRRQKP